MKAATQIKPISDLKSPWARIVNDLSLSREPTVISQNGDYLLHDFSQSTWLQIYGKLNASIRKLIKFPHLGVIPRELEALELQLNQYRQFLSGMNHVVYEIRNKMV
jgi:hypothetical protein